MFELTINDEIASAHFLRGYPGKCANLHGHTWKIEVIIQSQDLDDLGMVADFKVLKKALREVLEELDHVHLNELPAFKDVNPTAENLAKYIYQQYADKVKPISVKQARVWESQRASAIYYES